MDNLRIEFATEIFLASMRQSAAAAGSEQKIKALKDYPADQRSALMKAVRAAVASSKPESDGSFLDFKINRGAKT